MKALKIAVIAAASLALLLAASGVAAVTLFQSRYANRAYPGVMLQGRDVGGLSAEEIFALASTRSDAYFSTATLSLQTPTAVVDLRPADFGAAIDPAATVARALSIGRQGSLLDRLQTVFQTWREPVNVEAVVVMDNAVANRLAAHMAREVERPARDARIEVSSAGVREIPSQIGATLDAETLVALVRSVATKGEPATIALPLRPVAPTLASAADTVAEATQILGSDLVVAVPKWSESGEALAPEEAFRIVPANLPEFVSVTQRKDKPGYDVQIRRERFRALIEPLAKAVNTTAESARFRFDPAAKSLTAIAPSRVGRTLDVDATLDAVERALRSDNRGVVLTTRAEQPAVPATGTSASLGVSGLITQATTFFKGSSEARMKNVQVAGARFNGVVIPPGATFSFNQYLGDVSVEEGFEEGLIIVGDRTIKGVGGGVCQVSTTAFQAALRAGLPIVERYPHAYRVSYYERGMGPGLDATVFSPIVDLKFRNDTPGHIVIETVYDGKNATLTFRFWGTSDGRQVSFSQPVIGAVVKHGPDIYEPDPEGKVAAGKSKQVDYAVDGATIRVNRTVRRDGAIVRQDAIASKYVPWQAVFRYGPGFTPPPGSILRP